MYKSTASRIQRILFLALIFLASLSLSACSVLESARNLTSGEMGRTELLTKRLNKFTKALYWGSVDDATLFVIAEKRRDFYRSKKKELKDKKMVDIEVTDVEVGEDARTANVSVEIQYYEIPNFVVQKRMEQQEWEFRSLSGGWLYADAKEVDEEGEALADSGIRGSLK